MLDELRMKQKSFPKVRSKGAIYAFDVENIINSLVLEAEIDKQTAISIAAEVMHKIESGRMRYLTGALIRELCNVVLADRGLESARIKYSRIGLPMYDITQTIDNPTESISNANLMRNPETIAKAIHDGVMENYTLSRLPKRLGDAHLKGDIYIKDRDYFFSRDYCASWDVRQFLKQGLAPDGLGGMHSSYAKPAKHPIVAMNHAAIWLAAAQSNFAGGQGFFYFNALMAPYMRGLSYDEVKQVAQHFVFIMTQQYIARGGQVIFSSIDLTPGIPNILKDVLAVKPGGVEGPETYGDYEQEAKELFRAFMKVFLEGDGNGKPFNYPKPNIILREEFMDKENDDLWELVGELTAKYGLPYFENYLNWRKDIAAGCSSCCSHLWVAESEEELEAFKTGNMVFGASQMVTPNFPRIAWITRQFGGGTDEFFFTKLDSILGMCKDVFLIKKKAIEDIMNNGNAPFYTQAKPNGKPLLNIKDRMFLVGTVGFDEMCQIMTGCKLHEPAGQKFALKVLKYLNAWSKNVSTDLGLNVAVTRTPAESAAGRLARKDWKSYPGIRKYIKGTPDDPYYTNSVVVDVAAAISLSERIKIEGIFHPFLDGGALTHIYLDDRGNIDDKSMWELIKSIAKNTLNSYFSFTRDMVVCQSCGHVGLLHSLDDLDEDFMATCEHCGQKSVVMSRITGYLQTLNSFNSAKRQEFLDRYRYTLDKRYL